MNNDHQRQICEEDREREKTIIIDDDGNQWHEEPDEAPNQNKQKTQSKKHKK